MKNGKFRYLVKWLGFDEPTWEPEGNLRLINIHIIEEIMYNSRHFLWDRERLP